MSDHVTKIFQRIYIFYVNVIMHLKEIASGQEKRDNTMWSTEGEEEMAGIKGWRLSYQT